MPVSEFADTPVPPLPPEIQLDAYQVAAIFRHLSLTGCQVDGHGCPTWYFDGGLQIRHAGRLGYQLSVARRRS